MSRGYFNRRRYEGHYNKIVSSLGLSAEDQKEFDARMDRFKVPAFVMAARLCRLLDKDQKRFIDTLLEACNVVGVAGPKNVSGKRPIIVLAPPKGEDYSYVRVFKNLIPDSTSLSNITSYSNQTALESFLKGYEEDMADANRSKAWSSTRRIWQKLKAYDEITISAAITRYLNEDNRYTSSYIRDIAAHITDARKPMELTYADKPEDFIKMYANGPHSCMSNDKANAMGWDHLMMSKNHHPCSFFAYHPYVRGVYATKGDKVVARTYIYQMEDGKWQYGRVYCDTGALLNRFEQNLKDAGYAFMGPHESHKFMRRAKFTIPGIAAASKVRDYTDFLMPLPYCDNLYNKVHVSWDKEKKEFTVECMGADKTNINVKNGAGYITSSQISEDFKCEYCLENAFRHGHPITTYDGHIFCHAEHAQAKGYISAFNSERQQVYVLKNDVYKDEYEGTRYTNVAAAIANGCLPTIRMDSIEEDEEEVSRVGYAIRIGENLYTLVDPAHDVNGNINITQTSEIYNGNSVYKFKTDPSFMKPTEIKVQKVVEFDNSRGLLPQAA